MLQQILLYRELDFPLKEIKDMLSKPDYDRQEALAAHKSLLLLKIERLRRLTGLVDSMMRGCLLYTSISRIVYALVGICGLYLLTFYGRSEVSTER